MSFLLGKPGFQFSEENWLRRLLCRRRQHPGQGAKNLAAIARAEQVFTGAFGMRHQAHYVPAAAANAGDIITRAVWIRILSDSSFPVAIAKDNPFVSLKLGEGRVVTDKVSFGV